MRNLSKDDHNMKYRMRIDANVKDVEEHSEQKLDWSYTRRGLTGQWKMRQLLDAKSAIVSSDKRRL